MSVIEGCFERGVGKTIALARKVKGGYVCARKKLDMGARFLFELLMRVPICYLMASETLKKSVVLI